MLNLLAFRNTQCIEHTDELLGTEQTHQIIFQGNIELGYTRITLTTCTTSQLVINTSGFMSLCTDNHQTAGFSSLVIQLDICTTASHVSSNGNCSMLSCICNNLGFQFMEFCIQYLMFNAFSAKHATDLFRSFNRNRTYQYRLSLGMRCLYCCHDGI